MKELNTEELDKVAGGNIIDDATNGLTKLTNSIMTDVIQKMEMDNARSGNTAALLEAAKENGLVKKRDVTQTWNPGQTLINGR